MDRYLCEYAYVHRRFEDICRLLEDFPERILDPATTWAAERGEELRARLQVEVGGFVVERDVEVVIEGFDRHDHVARLSFAWKARRHASLFPAMHGDLEVYPLVYEPDPVSQIAFVGHYRPPLSWLGAAGDALVGRRIAESAVQHFVQAARTQIEHELSAKGVGKFLVGRAPGSGTA